MVIIFQKSGLNLGKIKINKMFQKYINQKWCDSLAIFLYKKYYKPVPFLISLLQKQKLKQTILLFVRETFLKKILEQYLTEK